MNRDLSVIEQRVVPEDLVLPVAGLYGSFGLDTWVYRGADWYVPDPQGSHVARATAITTCNAEEGFATAVDRFILPAS